MQLVHRVSYKAQLLLARPTVSNATLSGFSGSSRTSPNGAKIKTQKTRALKEDEIPS
jgi:hypothetical protein